MSCYHGAQGPLPLEDPVFRQFKSLIFVAFGVHSCEDDQAESFLRLVLFLLKNSSLVTPVVISSFYALSVDAYIKEDIATVRLCFICARLLTHIQRVGNIDAYFQLTLEDRFESGHETPWETPCIVRNRGFQVDRRPIQDFLVSFV
jgi:hypothetical protein